MKIKPKSAFSLFLYSKQQLKKLYGRFAFCYGAMSSDLSVLWNALEFSSTEPGMWLSSSGYVYTAEKYMQQCISEPGSNYLGSCWGTKNSSVDVQAAPGAWALRPLRPASLFSWCGHTLSSEGTFSGPCYHNT